MGCSLNRISTVAAVVDFGTLGLMNIHRRAVDDLFDYASLVFSVTLRHRLPCVGWVSVVSGPPWSVFSTIDRGDHIALSVVCTFVCFAGELESTDPLIIIFVLWVLCRGV